MAQAMNTSMSGINANQLHINVVADNIANMNTTAFKESQVTFQDVWYQTRTTGTAPGRDIGGTNPYQIGIGTKAAAITRNFEPNSVNTTGRNTHMAIEGRGFFTVMDGNGAVYYTRDGNFSLDGEGNLVTSMGYKVLGTSSSLSYYCSNTPVYVPMSIEAGADAQPAGKLGSKDLKDLNNAQICGGNFFVTLVTSTDGTQGPIEINITGKGTVQNMVNEINASLAAATPATAVRASVVNGGISFKLNGGGGGDVPKTLTFTSGTSNFVQETEISKINPAGGAYTSTTIDYKVDIGPANNLTNAISYKTMSVGIDGTIEITYDNGDKVTVVEEPQSGGKVFQYTTATGVKIYGPKDVTVDSNVLVPENLQIQFANVRNPEGLAGAGHNLYTLGANTGDVIYGGANDNGVGSVVTGGLEASNVDLSRQFSNMILAQRGIEANSRVFDTANNILQTLVYLGRG